MSKPAAVVPFQFKSNEIRTITTKKTGDVWFVASDVCSALGLQSVGKALERVPENHKGVNPIHTLGGEQQVSVISEAGMYRLVLRSNKPEAEPFIEWVTAEVLPAIRKTGSYTISKPKAEALTMPVGDPMTFLLRGIHILALVDEDGKGWVRAKDVFACAGYANPGDKAKSFVEGRDGAKMFEVSEFGKRKNVAFAELKLLQQIVEHLLKFKSRRVYVEDFIHYHDREILGAFKRENARREAAKQAAEPRPDDLPLDDIKDVFDVVEEEHQIIKEAAEKASTAYARIKEAVATLPAGLIEHKKPQGGW